MTENQLNKMFTNGHINMHMKLGSRLFTMLGLSVCKGNIQYSMSLIITFWLNKHKREGCLFLFLIMLMLSFFDASHSNMVHGELFSFYILGKKCSSLIFRGVLRENKLLSFV